MKNTMTRKLLAASAVSVFTIGAAACSSDDDSPGDDPIEDPVEDIGDGIEDGVDEIEGGTDTLDE